MVSQPAPAPADTRDRIRQAALEAFAARGFDGATVDRIAARARVNKAMLYYHFGSKAALYRHILRDLFASVAAAVAAIDPARPPDDQLRSFVDAVNDSALANPHFPGLWLRELAEVGRHLDAATIAEIGRVLQVLRRILEAGRAAGRFRLVHPLAVQLGIVGPLLTFAASAPLRERHAGQLPPGLPAVSREALVEYVKAVTLAAVANTPAPPAAAVAALRKGDRR